MEAEKAQGEKESEKTFETEGEGEGWGRKGVSVLKTIEKLSKKRNNRPRSRKMKKGKEIKRKIVAFGKYIIT